MLQTTLVSRLKLKLDALIKEEKRIESEELKKELTKERDEYYNLNINNVIQSDKSKRLHSDDSEDGHRSRKRERRDYSDSSRSGSSSSSGSTDGSSEPIYQLRQRRQANSYKFNEYDDLINSAIRVSSIS